MTSKFGPGTDSDAATYISAATSITYLAMVVVIEARVAVDPPARYLIPVFAPLVVSAVLILHDMAHVKSVTFIACAAFLAAGSLFADHTLITTADRDGLLDYSTPQWSDSPLLRYLQDHRLRGAVFSDEPYLLSLRLHVGAELTPERTFYNSRDTTNDLAEFRSRARKGAVSVVWIPGSYLPNLYRLIDLRKVACLTLVHHEREGDIYKGCGSSH